MAAGYQDVQQKAGKSPAKACHTGGPATAQPLRDELMVLLEGFLVFLIKSSRWKSQQQLESVRGQLLLHGARRRDQEGDSVTRECHSSPGPFRTLQCPGYHLPSSCLEPGSPAQPSEMMLPSLSLQLVADATLSRPGDAAHPNVPLCGTSVF